MATFFHVTSRRNRVSIERHGLDWRRMGAAVGIAGSPQPELAGVFLCRDEGEVEFFCGMNADGGEVDVWAVAGVDGEDLVESPNGFAYLAQPVPRKQLTLVDTPSVERPGPEGGSSTYRSTLTITFDDGRVLRDGVAHDWIASQRGPATG